MLFTDSGDDQKKWQDLELFSQHDQSKWSFSMHESLVSSRRFVNSNLLAEWRGESIIMPEGIRGAAAAQEVEITRRKFMTESLLVKRERERELKRHQERVQNMKPCVDTKPNLVRADSFPVRLNRPPVRSRIDKDKLRQIEKQNCRLLMKLRSIHKNYSLYMPKKHMYLLKGEACNLSKPGKKKAKCEEPVKNTMVETSRSYDNHFAVDEEMASRVAAMGLRHK